MSKTYTAAEVREIVGFLLGRENEGKKTDVFSSEAVRALFDASEGDLRYWGAFKEVFAFAYDPDTLEVSAVERADDFLADPTADLITALKDSHDGLSLEVWGVRHPWAAWCGDMSVGPICLHSFGRRPPGDDIVKVAETARTFEAPAIVYRR